MFQKNLEGERRKEREDKGREKKYGEECGNTVNSDFLPPFFLFLVTTVHSCSVPLRPSKTWVYKMKQYHYLVQEFKCLHITSNE